MRKYCLGFLVLLIIAPGAVHAAGGRDVLSQVSTIDALMTGIYDGETTLGSLKEKGDFGLGTFNTLDGEMLLLDGEFYRITAAGTVERPEPGTKTPFAAVTFFEADRAVPLEKGLDFRRFVVKTDRLLPTPNVFYVIKITGTFEMVRARSVARQVRPYRPLDEVVKNQGLFTLSNVEGTIVGFRCPPYVKGVNVPGYHLHFITADRKAGGHVLDFKIGKALLEVDDTSEFNLVLPSDKAFYDADLAPDREQAVRAVEK